MSTENALLTILTEKINNDTLVLPTLPAIALKIRKAADDPDVKLGDMSDVIGKDPALSARMIKIANSAYMGRSVKVNSVSQAVTRIGLAQIKNIATALAMEQLFVSKNELVKKYMARAWDNTVNVVANAVAALQLYNGSKKSNLSIDAMTLAALVHNIGVLPILTEAERHDDVFANPTFLNVAMQKLSPDIGGQIMRSWEFDEVFVVVAQSWRDLHVISEEPGYIDFVRLGAVLAGSFSSQKDAVMNICQQKGIVDDLNTLNSDEFVELRDNAKSIFV